MYLFENLNSLIQRYLPEDQIKLLWQAYIVARDAHEGQTRSSGEPYITHPVAVACILAEMHLDHETLMAALLHDVIEDTPATYQDVKYLFGKSVAKLVEGVSKLDKLKFRDKKEAQAENFRKMIMAMMQDIRVVLIKLADRTHNMRTLGALRPDKRRRIARETLEIYSPLANRLGIYNIKTELEELGFEALYPNRYRIIKKVIKAARGNRKKMIQKILADIEGHLTEAGVSCRVSGREKHIYSIYCKMHLKEQCFNSIMDIYAFRVIVREVDTCYRVLRQMHNLYKPCPGRVKDYIAIPKVNGYQSLHTAMIGPHGMSVEVQIRTEDMDKIAEMGVVAHWAYKKQDEIGIMAQIPAQSWMQSLFELQQSVGSSFEFIESVKSELLLDEIYVFTPEGRIVELSVGATSVDFAYAVHTDISHARVGARMDRYPYPLSQSFSSDQAVEIITESSACPNTGWLNFVVRSKVQTKIQQILKNIKHNSSINLSRYLLDFILGDSSKIINLSAKNIQYKLDSMKLAIIDNLLVEIDIGNVMSNMVAKNSRAKWLNLKHLTNLDLDTLLIKNIVDTLIIFAECCRPIPGDPIIAYVSHIKGLVVHHELCQNIHSYQNDLEKFIPVEWWIISEQEYTTKIKVDMINDQGALTNLTASISSTSSSIQSFSLKKKDGRGE